MTTLPRGVPPGDDAAPDAGNIEGRKCRVAGDTVSISQAVENLTQIQRRALQEAVNEGLAATWERRALDFEAARPRLGDYFGEMGRDQARAKWVELDEIARACRARAFVSRLHDEIDPDVDEALGVVA